MVVCDLLVATFSSSRLIFSTSVSWNISSGSLASASIASSKNCFLVDTNLVYYFYNFGLFSSLASTLQFTCLAWDLNSESFLKLVSVTKSLFRVRIVISGTLSTTTDSSRFSARVGSCGSGWNLDVNLVLGYDAAVNFLAFPDLLSILARTWCTALPLNGWTILNSKEACLNFKISKYQTNYLQDKSI